MAVSLARGLRLELFLTPKPGLVDLLDAGAHHDLSLPRMLASIDLMTFYLDELVELLQREVPLPALAAAGRRAEERMIATLATNTHRGAIFLGGLLLSARAASAEDAPEGLARAAAEIAGELAALQSPVGTHGDAARRRFAVGGILGEACAGLPALFAGALPAYGRALAAGGGPHLAAFAMLAQLMQRVEDTTALHRCGLAGLRRLQRDGAILERRLAGGEDPVPLLLRWKEDYRRLNLTMGGVADLLGMAFALLDYWGELVWSAAGAGAVRAGETAATG